MESFDRQFGLFDKAKADSEATVEAAQAALNTQLSFWQGYAANVADLKEISAEDLGVTQENYNALMEYVRSGTPEAAGLAADMVREINNGNTQALANLANTLGEINESQTEVAQDVAEWTTGLTKQMNQLNPISSPSPTQTTKRTRRTTYRSFSRTEAEYGWKTG